MSLIIILKETAHFSYKHFNKTYESWVLLDTQNPPLNHVVSVCYQSTRFSQLLRLILNHQTCFSQLLRQTSQLLRQIIRLLQLIRNDLTS